MEECDIFRGVKTYADPSYAPVAEDIVKLLSRPGSPFILVLHFSVAFA